MLWSPSEVLPFVRDEEPGDHQEERLLPIAPYGGFRTWPTLKDDFILFAENSEIHGPNPIFTIPELDAGIDLNLLSTQILSADYQGLSNNKILPGKNAQLLMPDLTADTHVAIVYFFLFDSEARGFVRPTCVAYFTADKNKLANLADAILKNLTEISLILQHFNITCTTDDMKSFKENVISSKTTQELKSVDVVNDLLLKDIQEVLQIVEDYKGREIYNKQISRLMETLASNGTTERLQSWIAQPLEKSTSDSYRSKLSCRPNARISMKDLYGICDKGVVLALYHAFLTHQYFNRKYENIVSANHIGKEKCLLFGACILNSKNDWENFQKKKCMLKSRRVPCTLSLADDGYFACVDNRFVAVLERFVSWNNESDPDMKSCEKSPSPTCSSEITATASNNIHCSKVEKRKNCQVNCSHVVSLGAIWDILEHIESQYLGIEKAFLRILRLFDNSQGVLFSVLTRSPVVVISSSLQLQEAAHFVTALSLFIPRSAKECVYVDANRKEALTKEELSKCVAVNICIEDSLSIENIVPLELMPRICILNLRDFSLTTPTYTGRLLSDVDQRIRALPKEGPIFSVIIGLLAEVERTVKWWDAVTSSSVQNSDASSYVLSKGYTRSDMQIIEKLYKLWED